MILTKKKIYKILVVDDNEMNIQTVGSSLHSANYSLGFAQNGAEALTLLEESDDYDLILLDIGMPVMDGFETCKAIRAIDKLKDTPIIFITAFNDLDNIVKGFDSGGQDYITKPFNQKELLARVKTHLELKNARDEMKNVNAWLEKKVKERTKELQLLNNQLEKQSKEIMAAYLKLETTSDALQKLDASKTTFLSLISHDFCTPITRLMSFLNTIKDKFVTANNTDILNIIENSSNRLERFSFVATRLSELQSYKKEVAGKFIPLAYFTDYSREKLKHKMRSGNIKLRIDADTNECFVRGDKILLQICFECILDNVYKYSDQNSEATIHVSSDNDKVTFDFINKEPAFIKEVNKNLNKVFETGKYYSDQNFGLDLALVKIIMDSFNGLINVRNNDNEGAVVSMKLNKL